MGMFRDGKICHKGRCDFRSLSAKLRILPEINIYDALKCATPHTWLKVGRNKYFQVLFHMMAENF
jgi:hypothetical protein